MFCNDRNKAAMKPRDVGQERSTEGGDVHPHLDLSLSLSSEGTSGNRRNVKLQEIPPVGILHPDAHVGIQQRMAGSSTRGTFLIGRARARIERRAAIFMERASGLPMVYPPTWTAATATVAVNAAMLHGMVLGHAGIVTGPTGAGNDIHPPFLIGGSTNSPLIPSQRGLNNHPAPHVLPPIRSNLVPMFATSMTMGHPLVVTTMGNGPVGRQIYGVIIGQVATAEMHIMCSCHGIVLTPAAFVEHAGGTSSGQPMDRIVVCMRPIPF